MRLSFVQFSLLFLSFLFLSSDIYSESSSEYVEKIHADILKVVIAKQSIYEEYPGWDKPTAGATSFDQLPKKAVDYVMRLENLIGCPVDIISTGPKRHEAITRRSIL